MNWENFSVVNSYLREPGRTFIAIRCDIPFTAYERIVEADIATASDEVKITAVLDIVATEIDPSGAIANIKNKSDRTTVALEKANDLIEKMHAVILIANETLEEQHASIEFVYDHLGLKMDGEEESDQEPTQATENEIGADVIAEEQDGGDAHD